MRSFRPIADSRSKVLILGSMPGPTALKKAQYYGFDGNHFWRLMAGVLGRAGPPRLYPEKIRMLRNSGVALWDVLESCVRPTAMDHHIRRPQPNDISGLIRDHPHIRAIFLNGRTSERYFNRYFGGRIRVPGFYLPSSSPANASIPYRTKLKRWSAILRWINGDSPRLFIQDDQFSLNSSPPSMGGDLGEGVWPAPLLHPPPSRGRRLSCKKRST